MSVDKKSWKYYNNFCYGLIRRDKSVPERPASGGAGGVNLCCGRAEAKLPQRMGSLPLLGKEVTMQVKAGDKVIFSKYSGTEVEIEDEKYVIVKQSDILAVVE